MGCTPAAATRSASRRTGVKEVVAMFAVEPDDSRLAGRGGHLCHRTHERPYPFTGEPLRLQVYVEACWHRRSADTPPDLPPGGTIWTPGDPRTPRLDHTAPTSGGRGTRPRPQALDATDPQTRLSYAGCRGTRARPGSCRRGPQTRSDTSCCRSCPWLFPHTIRLRPPPGRPRP
jgi:hypothetical protein